MTRTTCVSSSLLSMPSMAAWRGQGRGCMGASTRVGVPSAASLPGRRTALANACRPCGLAPAGRHKPSATARSRRAGKRGRQRAARCAALTPAHLRLRLGAVLHQGVALDKAGAAVQVHVDVLHVAKLCRLEGAGRASWGARGQRREAALPACSAARPPTVHASTAAAPAQPQPCPAHPQTRRAHPPPAPPRAPPSPAPPSPPRLRQRRGWGATGAAVSREQCSIIPRPPAAHSLTSTELPMLESGGSSSTCTPGCITRQLPGHACTQQHGSTAAAALAAAAARGAHFAGPGPLPPFSAGRLSNWPPCSRSSRSMGSRKPRPCGDGRQRRTSAGVGAVARREAESRQQLVEAGGSMQHAEKNIS